MTLRHLILFTLFLPTILFGQTDTSKKSTDALVEKLETWDYGYRGCYASTITDTIMDKLIVMGKPIAKQLLPYLDSTEKAVPIHIILSVIYGDTLHSEEKTISKTETTIIRQREINGLVFTAEVSSEGAKHTIDSATQLKVREMWRKRIQ